jgi:acyl-CoA synthetase (AMP-forming)/AMP-acid ligase II
MSVTPHQEFQQKLLEGARANVVALLSSAAKHRPQSGVYVAHGERRCDPLFPSYPILLDEADAYWAVCKRAGNSRPRIALLLERPRDFVPAFWACKLGGYVSCPVGPIRNGSERWETQLARVDGRPWVGRLRLLATERAT